MNEVFMSIQPMRVGLPRERTGQGNLGSEGEEREGEERRV